MHRPHPSRPRRRGLGLVELLVTVAICAALLTAVAAATHASFRAYAINQAQADLTQRARVTLDRILEAVRVTEAHAPADAATRAEFGRGLVVDDNGITMIDTGGSLVTWSLDPATRSLVYDTPDGRFVMLRNVHTFRVTFEPMRSPSAIRAGTGYDLMRRATIVLVVGVGDDAPGIDAGALNYRFTLSSSVVPRRNVGV